MSSKIHISDIGNFVTSSALLWRRLPFLAGMFLLSLTVLVFQIVQTRILSVISWYYLAFFGISMAMLGMTAGAVYAYLRREYFTGERLGASLTNYSLACAVAIPISLLVQLSLVTSLVLSLTTIFAWALLTVAMAVPYFFAGVAVSLALTRSPFPVNQVYGVDLIGAALGCLLSLWLLSVLDGPSVVVAAGVLAAFAAVCFSAAAPGSDTKGQPMWRQPWSWAIGLSVCLLLNASSVHGIRPLLVKDIVEKSGLFQFEKWNSYSRIMATAPASVEPQMWGASPRMPHTEVMQAYLNIDGAAGTSMPHYDGTPESIYFLRYDLVNLAYNLPGVHKAAVIGVGGGRDLMSAHLFGADQLVGVELNPIFVGLHTTDPFYSQFSGLTRLPNLSLHVADARSWFASTHEKFDLVQMSMIDTWAATGAGAFSLSENGLYTLQGWRAFLKTLNNDGLFTVSRWYRPDNVDETGRMVSLATAALLDAGVAEPKTHLFVAHADHIATLVLSKRPLTPEQLKILHERVDALGFGLVLAPDASPASPLLAAIVNSNSISEVDAHVANAYLDLSVPTDNRPFFFNQLKLTRLKDALRSVREGGKAGVLYGNLLATAALVLILGLSIIAVIVAIVLPLRSAGRSSERALIVAGTGYFFLIGMGFMLSEIAILQYFSVYLGHPIYSLGICLFSLILATGIGSLLSSRVNIATPLGMMVWTALAAGYLLLLQAGAVSLFEATTNRDLAVRVGLSVALIMPLGILLGFAFPTGMRLTTAINAAPAPWFWGINGATGVLASGLAVLLSMNFGINVTMGIGGLCYLALMPFGLRLISLTNVTDR